MKKIKAFFKKVKEFFAKVGAWIKKMLKRFEFDNKLFAIGIRICADQVKENTNEKTADMQHIVAQFKMRVLKEFDSFPKITKLINDCMATVVDNVDSKVIVESFEKQVDAIADNIIKYYNANF